MNDVEFNQIYSLWFFFHKTLYDSKRSQISFPEEPEQRQRKEGEIYLNMWLPDVLNIRIAYFSKMMH